MKFLKTIKSRTVWTAITLGAINTVPQLQEIIPMEAQPYVNIGLIVANIFFRVNPKQNM